MHRHRSESGEIVESSSVLRNDTYGDAFQFSRANEPVRRAFGFLREALLVRDGRA
jgi:hypothetical protein